MTYPPSSPPVAVAAYGDRKVDGRGIGRSFLFRDPVPAKLLQILDIKVT
jgi:hypothetical protein